MFIDQENNQNPSSPTPEMGGSFFDSKKNLIILLVALFLLFSLIVGAMAYFSAQKKKTTIQPKEEITATTTESEVSEQATSSLVIGLPKDPSGERSDNGVFIFDNIKGEELSFGSYYKKITDDADYTFSDYDLPINIKTDAVNYYEISRKLNLDPYLDALNEDGFVIIDNPFASQADNFYGIYDFLSEQQIPVAITSDFLLYYQQNIFKKVFKEIEANVFYDNLWSINYKMYRIAKARYERILAETGITNDPVLEGARTELAYFAVALKILEPKENQIKEQAALAGGDFFSYSEANAFRVNFPTYLQGQVDREYELIKNARDLVKSPALLYERDYSAFKVPADYQGNARLNNFYLASKWANSLFPLYYKGELCPNCLLDREDWRINLIAASLISKDLAENQDIKNQWAVIYKVLAFFTGLRSDLNYLYYEDALARLFGEGLDVEAIFSLSNENREENFSQLQRELIGFDFLEAEGAYSRKNPDDFAKIGLRVLSEPYWPDTNIFRQLNSPNSGVYLGGARENPPTICKRGRERCSGIGLDIVNLVYPISDNDYFAVNSNYSEYKNQANKIRSQLDRFNVYSWHGNSFWVNLDIAKTYLNYDNSKQPSFMRTSAWEKKRINTALGSLANLQLPMDKLSYYTQREGGLGGYANYTELNYIEPDLKLAQELRANTIMLKDVLSALGISGSANSVSIDLQEMEGRLFDVEKLITKQLNGQEFDGNDLRIFESFIKQFSVLQSGRKELVLQFSHQGDVYRRTQNLSGVKLIVLVHEAGGKKALALGPIFNYQER